MTPFTLYARLAAGAVVLSLLAGAVWKIHAVGRSAGQAEVQAAWDAEKAARLTADNAAILTAVKNNERAREQDAINNQRITKAKHDEISKIRADYDRAAGLRISANICSGFAGVGETNGAGRSDDTGTGTRLLPAATDRDLKSLMLECEATASTVRAAQEFITINGLAP